jgi:protein TonB
MSSNNIKNQSWEDLVFDGRNKEFGAYALRKMYDHVLVKSFIMAVLALVMIFTTQYWGQLFAKDLDPEVASVKTIKYTELAAPPMIEKIQPPKMDLPPPVKTVVKYLPPKVTEKEVLEEEAMPTVEEIKENATGAVNVEGTGDVVLDETPVVTGYNGDNGDANKVFTIVEESPIFEGGIQAMYDFISKNTQYPKQAQRMGIEGTVYISFIVSNTGKITNITVAKSLGGGCDEEAMRVIGLMPEWTPGKQGGRAVNTSFMLPFKFRLD